MRTALHRIREKKDFQRVFQKGRSVPDHLFLLRYLKRSEPAHSASGKISRFGFVVSTKVSKKAVVRNRIKRRLREIVRKEPFFLATGYDYVFIIKKHDEEMSFSLFKKAVLDALVKAK